MEDSIVLHVSRLAKAYRAGSGGCSAFIEVLRGVSLRLKPGDFATIEGRRGSGKTTLLRCAAGLLRPDAGQVQWPTLATRGGAPLSGVSLVADRAPAHAFLTVRESLGYAATVREAHLGAQPRETDALIELAALTHVAEVRVGLLAGAERARLQVALGLVSSPVLLLVDDADGGPDAVGRAAFARFLVRVASSGVAVLWSARAVGAVADATAAFLLAAGRLRRAPAGTPDGRRVRRSLELDVHAAGKVAAMLAPRVPVVECRGPRVLVPLEKTTAEEVLAICRTLSIPVNASRVVREP
jgi:ABC-type multidrug transport system ATPase subunit